MARSKTKTTKCNSTVKTEKLTIECTNKQKNVTVITMITTKTNLNYN